MNAVSDALDKFVKSPIQLLLAHNGKEFDFPYLSRRMVINQVKLPIVLDTAGKKPWELNHLDTMELWKFGDFKAYTSLELLAATFDIPTPKDDIDGSMVCDIYYNDRRPIPASGSIAISPGFRAAQHSLQLHKPAMAQ